MRSRIMLLITAMLVTASMAVRVSAQQAPSVSLDMIPTNPAPLSEVQVSVSSYAIDVNQSTITWTYGGKVVASGIGKKSISVIAPNSGMVSTVGVTVESSGNDPVTESIAINPASVDLLWEAPDSYTPPFYKGKAKPATGAAIKAVAIPAYAAPKQLSFQWTHNDSAEDAVSGFNKSSILFRNDYLTQKESIGVEVTGGLFKGNGNTSVDIGDPSLVCYQNNAGFIDYANGGTSSIISNTPGTILHVEPYFFSAAKGLSKSLNISFTDTAGAPIAADTMSNELSLSKPQSGSDSLITIAITTIEYSLQNIKRDVTVTFAR